jgi:uncharacterized protein DUF6011
MPICGNCHDWHDTAELVWECYGFDPPAQAPVSGMSGPAEPEELEAGVYKHDGRLYMVKRAIHGSGKMYALHINPTCDNCGRGAKGHDAQTECDELKIRMVMAKGMVRKIRSGEKLTRDQQAEYGRIYGFCVRCGATLTLNDSILRGMGTTCWANSGRAEVA